MTAKLLEFKREGWRDPVRTLRSIADDLESGELTACSVGALALLDRNGCVTVFGIGPKAEDLAVLALFRLGEQEMADEILGRGAE